MAIIKRTEKGSPLTYNELDNNFDELDKIPNGKVFPSINNVGIKLSGSTEGFGWHTIASNLSTIQGDANAAEFLPYIGNNRAFKFDEQDVAFSNFLIPHDYVDGSKIFAQVHWSHSSTVVTGGTVAWDIEIVYAKGYSQQAFESPVFVSLQDDVNSTQYNHEIAEGPISIDGGQVGVLLDNNDLEIGGVVQCRLKLVSNNLDTSDGSTPNIYVHFFNLHYQSTGLPTLNKVPNFYT